MEEDEDYYSKEEVKKMISDAIDKMPDCAKIDDCVMFNSTGSYEAEITIHIQIPKEIEDSDTEGIIQDEFYDYTHSIIDLGMDFYS